MFGRYPFAGGVFARSKGSLVIVVFNAATRMGARSLHAITGLVQAVTRWGARSRTVTGQATARVSRYGARDGTARGSLN